MWTDFVHYVQLSEVAKVEFLRIQCWDWYSYDQDDFIGSISFPMSQLRQGLDGFFQLEGSYEKAVLHITCIVEQNSVDAYVKFVIVRLMVPECLSLHHWTFLWKCRDVRGLLL